LCHEPGAVDQTDHPSFHQLCVWIQGCLEALAEQNNYYYFVWRTIFTCQMTFSYPLDDLCTEAV